MMSGKFVEGLNVLNKANIISYSEQNGFYAYSYRYIIVPLHHTSLTQKYLVWNEEYPEAIEGNLIFI